ncbi:MAG: hypothetical protein Tsb0021_09940 [Chlamydiales bacterium]
MILKKFIFSFILLSSLHVFPSYASLANPLSEAEWHSQKGLESKELAQKQYHFNQALQIYLEIAEEYQSTHNQGFLYYNIANLFVKLNDYPWAVYYYLKALKYYPRDKTIIQNLTLTQNALGIRKQYSPPLLTYWEIALILTAFILIILIYVSLYIWTHRQLWLKSTIGIGCVAFLFLTFVVFKETTEPITGIIIKPTFLRAYPNDSSGLVVESPLRPGITVHVIDSEKNGTWLQAISDNNEVGFIYYQDIRLI